jgi:hypothetical protein
MNKRILIVFGLLDIITFVINFSYAGNYFERLGFELNIVGFLVLYVSLPFSALLLILQKRIGIWVSYAQVPLRFLFMVLSFGFILRLVRVYDDYLVFYDAFMWVTLGLELLRLAITVQIHRKYY